MLNNNTIKGQCIYQISAMFVAKINEPGVQYMQDDFFVTHDCLHYFTGLGVTLQDEQLVKEIQFFMTGKYSVKDISKEAIKHIVNLRNKGVFDDLKDCLIESSEAMQSLIK